ncbi:MAG: ribulose-phosphate 3-epimerase [bacterium]|nr:ribulose-phosphate 3-epimerase [bacterium]
MGPSATRADVPIVAPSILSADFGRIADEVRAVTAAGADWIHVDVMDGHFVPPITIGPVVVEAVRRATALPLDVHLMIERPELKLDSFAKAGADRMTVHVEACEHPAVVLHAIREAGCAPGITLNPETDLERVRPLVQHADLLLIMTVHPGWGGQPIVEGWEERIAAARRIVDQEGARCLIEVDGGIKAFNAARAVAAGADVLVAGSAVFEASDYAQAIRALRGD